MRKLLILIAAVAALLVAAAPAVAAKSKALSGTQKIAAKACAQSTGCTGWRASCRGPNRKRQWKCKATNFFDDGTTCLIGMTWVQSGGKLFLAKLGQPQCFGPASAGRSSG
jgi:hypothetical protein